MNDPVDNLERLQRLHAQGALSNDEFVAAKARLLAPSASANAGVPWVWLAAGAALVGSAGLSYMLIAPISQSDGVVTESNLTDETIPANAVADAPAPTVRDLPANEQLATAFRAAWGRDGSAMRRISDGTARFVPGRLVWLGGRAALISLGTIPDGCHGCSGTLAIHYLRPTANSFEVEGEWLDRAGGSSWGAPGSDLEISNRFGPHPVVYSEGGGTWQGYTCSVAHLTELGPREPIQSPVVPIHMDNGGAVLEETGRTGGGDAAREVSGHIVEVRKGVGFTVRFRGTERFDETYVYRNGRFVRTSGESRATC